MLSDHVLRQERVENPRSLRRTGTTFGPRRVAMPYGLHHHRNSFDTLDQERVHASPPFPPCKSNDTNSAMDFVSCR